MTSAIRAIFAQIVIVFLSILMSCTAWAKEISGRVVALQYSAAKDIARQKKRGLWVDEAPTPPWEWQRKK